MKIMKNSRLIPLAALAVAGALAASTATFALFVSTPPAATNSLTIGEVSVKVIEDGWTTGTAKPIEENEAAVAKAPQVKNTGTVPVWVRVTVAGLENYKTYFGTESEPSFNGGTAGDTWTKAGDIFYYNQPLEAGNTTAAIFDSVQLINASGGLDIIVFAEAVQADWVDIGSGGYADTAQKAFEALSGTNP
ncbi:MAG: hypothetical protein LBT12_01655 [Oscillospiraceae bacterium]|jgi:hypothetical protein|nr:hypothetical protein [Oscillospiraceae bacterium]